MKRRKTQFKVKAAQRMPNGDAISCETLVDADTWDEACSITAKRLLAHCRAIANQTTVTLHKVKVERVG